MGWAVTDNFLAAFEQMIIREGGYRLTNHQNDRGGLTYAGIARNRHPSWAGWAYIDRNDTPPAQLVREFYKDAFWNPINLDEVVDAKVAGTIFDFGVNAGASTAAKLAQIVVKATPDGKVGPKTIEALNAIDPALFLAHYTIAKIARYRDIVRRDKTQGVFLLGWINRALEQAG